MRMSYTSAWVLSLLFVTAVVVSAQAQTLTFGFEELDPEGHFISRRTDPQVTSGKWVVFSTHFYIEAPPDSALKITFDASSPAQRAYYRLMTMIYVDCSRTGGAEQGFVRGISGNSHGFHWEDDDKLIAYLDFENGLPQGEYICEMQPFFPEDLDGFKISREPGNPFAEFVLRDMQASVEVISLREVRAP